MPVTIKDIARKATVSHSTVSRALLGNPLVAEKTARRIRKIASDMGYLPSVAARSLKTNRSQALGVIISHIDDPYFSEILQGIEETAQNNEYSLFIAASQRDPERERNVVQTMREHRVDGVIICSTPFSNEQSKALRSYNIPIVVINNQAAEDYRYSIYHDDMDGSRQVTQHLITLGHKKIAYLGNASSGRTNLERMTGFRKQMHSAGLNLVDSHLHEVQGSNPEIGTTAANYFLSLPERPSAIFCFNDMLAIGLLKGLQQAGVQVPEDCSVAGFDNITFSAYTNPPLTTFDQPKRFIGAEAARLVLDLLDRSFVEENQNQPRVRRLKGRLLVRLSTAAPGVIQEIKT